ncbi:MAG: hypothetical protein ACYCQI_03870 [Gammaproteobacteria bacterium]
MNKEKFLQLALLIQDIARCGGEKKLAELKAALSSLDRTDDINAIHEIRHDVKYSLQEFAVEQYVTFMGQKEISADLYKVIEMLFANGANPNIKDQRRTPLLSLVVNSFIGNPEEKLYLTKYHSICQLLELFFQHRADFSVQDELGNSAIMATAQARNYDLIYQLHIRGCGLNLPNKNMQTVLDLVKGKEKYDTYASLFVTRMEGWGAVTWKSLNGIRYERGRLFQREEKDLQTFSLTFDTPAHKFVKASQFEEFAKEAAFLNLTRNNMSGINCVELARELGKLTDLFNNDAIRAAIQSQFPYAQIRAWVEEVNSINQKIIAKQQAEADTEENEVTDEVTLVSLSTRTLFAAKAPTPEEDKANKLFVQVKAAISLNNPVKFTSTMQELISLVGPEQAWAQLKDYNPHTPKLKKTLSTFLSLEKTLSPKSEITPIR